jgi:hypothetical protein
MNLFAIVLLNVMHCRLLWYRIEMVVIDACLSWLDIKHDLPQRMYLSQKESSPNNSYSVSELWPISD